MGRELGKVTAPLCGIFVISQWHWHAKVELEEENVGDSKLLDINVSRFSSLFTWIAEQNHHFLSLV